MKIKFDIEATPQELRSFFGLPDLEPLQQEMLDAIRKNITLGTEGFDPVTLMRPFLPEQMSSLTSLQQSIWQTMLGTTNPTGTTESQTTAQNKEDKK